MPFRWFGRLSLQGFVWRVFFAEVCEAFDALAVRRHDAVHFPSLDADERGTRCFARLSRLLANTAIALAELTAAACSIQDRALKDRCRFQ